MEANSIFSRWDDLVFEHRNKVYGAYLLRRHYPDRLFTGVIITTMAVLIIFSLHDAAKNVSNTPPPPPLKDSGTIRLVDVPIIEARTRKQINVEHPRQKVRRNTVPIVTTDEVVGQEEIAAIEEVVSFSDSGEGDGTIGDEMGLVDLPIVTPVSDEPMIMVEVMPAYDGGQEAMMSFIRKHIRYPRVPRQLGIDGTVYVRFVVNGDGSVSNVEVVRGIHRDCDHEAVRVVSMLSGWKGGRHNGMPARVRMVLPIKFRLE